MGCLSNGFVNRIKKKKKKIQLKSHSGIEDLQVSSSALHSEHSAGLTRNQQEYR